MICKRFVLAGMILLLLLPSAASASFTVRTSNDQKGQFDFVVRPGQRVDDYISISNNSEDSVMFRVYGADGYKSKQGSFALKSLSDSQMAVGKWLNFNSDSVNQEAKAGSQEIMGRLSAPTKVNDSYVLVELKGKESKKIPFVIVVPTKISPGAYTGGIGVETAASKSTLTGGGMGVSIIARFAVRVFVSVPGAKLNKPVVENFTYQYIDNKPKFKITFKNAGNTILSQTTNIEIFGWPDANTYVDEMENVNKNEELRLQALKQKQSNIIPISKIDLGQGEFFIADAEWKKNPIIGFYEAVAMTTFSEYDVATAKYVNPQIVIKKLNFVVVRWDVLLVLLLIILFVIAIVIVKLFGVWSLRKQSKPYVIKGNETLVSLANGAGVSWKKLAQINRVKAPYILQKDQVLLIPTKKK
jgi:hypothetical protein